jgi:ABC-type multidrug transport system ATPase subunit
VCSPCSTLLHVHSAYRLTPPDLNYVAGGDALVFGEALSAPGGMDRIRSRMGVCPQFDILWKELTGREHLRIYGAIKVCFTVSPSSTTLLGP